MIRTMSATTFACAGLVTLAVAAAASATAEPATRPLVDNRWRAEMLAYERAAVPVEEATPTAAQIDWRTRPPQIAGPARAIVPTTRPAKPAAFGPMNAVRLRFKGYGGDDVTALLCTPAERSGPFPVVVALHGLGSNKAQVIAQMGPALGARGFAVLAIDMPGHGERPGSVGTLLDGKDVRKSYDNCRRVVFETRQAIDIAETRPELDTRAGVVLAGYSMGAIMNSVIGPSDARVKAMVLMVGGAPDIPPVLALVPQLAALQPQLALPHFAPRPVLMLNAKADPTIRREMAERLFDAAAEPKRQVWYDGGHHLPAQAFEDAADWVAGTWKGIVRTP